MDSKDRNKLSKSFAKGFESAVAATDLSGQVQDAMAMQQAMQSTISQEKGAVAQNQKHGENPMQKASEYASKTIENGHSESQKNQKPNSNKMEKKDTPQRKNATGQNGSSGSSYNTNVKTSFGKVQPATPQRKAASTTPKSNAATPTRKAGAGSTKSQGLVKSYKENSSMTTPKTQSSGKGGQPTPKPPTNSKSPSKGPTR